MSFTAAATAPATHFCYGDTIISTETELSMLYQWRCTEWKEQFDIGRGGCCCRGGWRRWRLDRWNDRIRMRSSARHGEEGGVEVERTTPRDWRNYSSGHTAQHAS